MKGTIYLLNAILYMKRDNNADNALLKYTMTMNKQLITQVVKWHRNTYAYYGLISNHTIYWNVSFPVCENLCPRF